MSEQKPTTHHRPNYVIIFLALGIITGLEVLVTYITGIPRAPFLLAMSFIKAVLVLLFFMHLRSDDRWFAVIFVLPFLLVVPLMLVAITQ